MVGGVGPSAGSQWQIPNCADTICPHSAAAAAHLAGANLSQMPPSSLMQATGSMLPMPPMPPMFANGGGKFRFQFSLHVYFVHTHTHTRMCVRSINFEIAKLEIGEFTLAHFQMLVHSSENCLKITLHVRG